MEVVVTGLHLALWLLLDQRLSLILVGFISRPLMKSGLWFRLLPTSNARRPTKFVLFHAGITGCRSLPLLLNCVTTRLRRAAKSLLLLCILVVRVR